MADETIQEEQAEQPQGGEVKETDWKAEARKWESRAKKSEAAAIELEAIKMAQMTEQEKATARAEKAEAELAAIKAENARMEKAQQIAAQMDVPISLLGFVKDEDMLVDFAKAYKESISPIHAAASANHSRIISSAEGKPTNAQLFADVAAQMLKG